MKIGYTYVVADIFHVGHLRYLKGAKKLCDKLIVGVLTDDATMERKDQPTIPYKQRLEIVKSIGCVDEVVMQDTYTPLHNVKAIKPHVLIESSSHHKDDIAEARQFIKRFDGRVEVLPYYKGQSSTLIKGKIIYEYTQQEAISS